MCIFEWDVYDNVSFEYGHKIARKQHVNGVPKCWDTGKINKYNVYISRIYK